MSLLFVTVFRERTVYRLNITIGFSICPATEHVTTKVTHSFPPFVPLTHTSRAPVLVMVCALSISKNVVNELL